MLNDARSTYHAVFAKLSMNQVFTDLTVDPLETYLAYRALSSPHGCYHLVSTQFFQSGKVVNNTEQGGFGKTWSRAFRKEIPNTMLSEIPGR